MKLARFALMPPERPRDSRAIVCHMDTKVRPSERLVAHVEPQLAKAVEELARRHDRSVSGEIRAVLRAYLEGGRSK